MKAILLFLFLIPFVCFSQTGVYSTYTLYDPPAVTITTTAYLISEEKLDSAISKNSALYALIDSSVWVSDKSKFLESILINTQFIEELKQSLVQIDTTYTETIKYDLFMPDNLLPNIDVVKNEIKKELLKKTLEFSSYITACENIYGENKPLELIDAITAIKEWRVRSISEIEELLTLEDACSYILVSTDVCIAFEMLKNYLQ